MSDDAVVAATRLVALLARENAALSALDLSEAGRLLPEKRAATEALARASAATDKDRGVVIGLAGQILTLAADNRVLLERALAVQRRILEIIARAAQPAAGGYGAGGTARRPNQMGPIAISARI